MGGLMDTLDLDSDQRALFAHRIALVVESIGKLDEAQEIRRRFDTPAVDEKFVDISKPDGELWDRPARDEESPLQQEPWWNSEPPGEPEQDE
jgi:hypothetical protein